MDLEKKKNLTTEEQRAFLGVYWISVGYVLPTTRMGLLSFFTLKF
jgi:hypothetical protein